MVPGQFVDRDTVVALGHLSWQPKSTGEPTSVSMARVCTFARAKATTFEKHVDTVKIRELIS